MILVQINCKVFMTKNRIGKYLQKTATVVYKTRKDAQATGESTPQT
jgi:hypothetical protein